MSTLQHTVYNKRIYSRLRVPSQFTPPSGRSASLDLYCANMEKAAASFVPNPSSEHFHNLSSSERRALRSLSGDHSLTIREADKGGRMVVMDTAAYDTDPIYS